MNPVVGSDNQLTTLLGSGLGLTSIDQGGSAYSPNLPGQVLNVAAPTSPTGTATPTDTTGGTTYGGSTGGTTATAPTQQSLIDAQLNRLPNQQRIGSANILDQYNSALAQLTNNNALATRNYQTAVQQAQAGNQTAKSNIDAGVANQLSGLQRLLGSRGSGNSSAAYTLAPYAAGREGSIQRGQVQNAFGQNMNALDTNYADTQNQFQNATGNLADQRTNQQNALQAQLDQVRQNLLSQEANPDVNQINALGTQIDNLGRQVTFTPQAVNYTTPDLAKYNYAAPQIQANNGTSAADQYVTPYSYLLNGDQRKSLAGAAA